MAIGDGLSKGDTNVGCVCVGSGWGVGDFVGDGVIRGDSKKEVECGIGPKSIMGVGKTGELIGDGIGT